MSKSDVAVVEDPCQAGPNEPGKKNLFPVGANSSQLGLPSEFSFASSATKMDEIFNYVVDL